jgi:hypothetical protein
MKRSETFTIKYYHQGQFLYNVSTHNWKISFPGIPKEDESIRLKITVKMQYGDGCFRTAPPTFTPTKRRHDLVPTTL